MKTWIKTIIGIQRMYFDTVTHETKVTCINVHGKRGWNIRILTNGLVNQEARVVNRSDISRAIKSMLRIEHKCGNYSSMAYNSRHR